MANALLFGEWVQQVYGSILDRGGASPPIQKSECPCNVCIYTNHVCGLTYKVQEYLPAIQLYVSSRTVRFSVTKKLEENPVNTSNPPSMVPTRQLHLLTTKLTTGPYVNNIHTIRRKKYTTQHSVLNERHLFKVRIIAKEKPVLLYPSIYDIMYKFIRSPRKICLPMRDSRLKNMDPIRDVKAASFLNFSNKATCTTPVP